MAKQLVSPVERHFEKGIVGLAALLLLGVIAKYLILSPNQKELGGKKVTPNTIDAVVAQAADGVRERFRRASFDDTTPDPLYGEFVRNLDPLGNAGLSRSLPLSVTIGPKVPMIDPPEAGPGGTELAAVVPFTRVGATVGRTTFVVETKEGQRHLETNWVTVSGLFDVKAQGKEFIAKCGVLHKEVHFGMPHLQRRVQAHDGSWSEADWDFVDPWRLMDSGPLPIVPVLSLVESGGAIELDRNAQGDLGSFLNKLQLPNFQLDLIRPMAPERANGDMWDFPVLTSRRDVLMQDDQYLFPDQAAAQEPVDRYRKEDDGARVLVVLSKDEAIAAMFAKYDRLIASARKNLIKNDAIRAQNLMFEIEEDPDAKSSQKREATKRKGKAAVLESTIERQLRRGVGPTGGDTSAGDDAAARKPLPAQQLWAQDGKAGSVESGKTYQYRLRAVLYNTLAGRPEKFLNPSDATEIWLVGPWSDPVEVAIAAHTRYFVTGDDKGKRAVTVEFYSWFEGVWIRSRRLKVGVGEPLRDDQQRVVPDTDDQTRASRAVVEFVADASVLDVDFDWKLRERRRGTSRSGVKFGDARAETAVVLVTADGTLVERFVPTDKANPERKAFDARLWKAPKNP